MAIETSGDTRLTDGKSPGRVRSGETADPHASTRGPCRRDDHGSDPRGLNRARTCALTRRVKWRRWCSETSSTQATRLAQGSGPQGSSPNTQATHRQCPKMPPGDAVYVDDQPQTPPTEKKTIGVSEMNARPKNTNDGEMARRNAAARPAGARTAWRPASRSRPVSPSRRGCSGVGDELAVAKDVKEHPREPLQQRKLHAHVRVFRPAPADLRIEDVGESSVKFRAMSGLVICRQLWASAIGRWTYCHRKAKPTTITRINQRSMRPR